MIGRAAGQEVVVLDAVQVRCFFEQIIQRIVVPERDQDVEEIGPHRLTRDIEPPFADGVDRDDRADLMQRVGRERADILARA